MIAILSVWFYIFVTCFVYGFAAVKFLLALLKEDASDPIPLSIIIISGLCLVSTIAGYLSLFLKIGLVANAFVFIGTLLLAIFYHVEIKSFLKYGLRRSFAIDKYVSALLLISFLFILARSAATPSSFDTGLYHAQAIRWIEEYPVVPGLGNLHGRLAFNSAWFPANALFGFSFLKLQPFHVLNGFFLLIISFVSLTGLSNVIKGQYKLSNILRAGISIPAIFIFKDQLSSPTPDLPAALLICLIFIYYVQLHEDDADVPHRLLSLIMVLLAAWAITIKMSALPLVIFIVVIAGHELAQRRLLTFLMITGAALLMVLPYFLRNIWLSGYLVYPFPSLDFFNFDWKIPAAEALAEKRAIAEFARDPGYLAAQIAVKGPFYWLPAWLQQTMADYGKKLEKIFLPGLVILLDCLVNMIKQKTCKIAFQEIGNNKVVYLTAAAGLFFWFVTAPDPRFGMGFIIIAVIIIFIPFLKAYDYQVTRFFPWSISLLLLYFLIAFGTRDLPAMGRHLWFPAPYPQAPLTVQEIQGRKVYFPRKGELKCWYAPLPCAYHPVKFAWRGDRLEDGFKARGAP